MRTSLTILFLVFAFGLRADDQLPFPPSGFSWQRLAQIKSVLLKPDSWHFKHSKKGQTDGFFITKEDIDKAGVFKTGLTLNCVRDIPKKSGLSPSSYAAALADAAAKKFQLVERSASKQGPFRAVRFRYVDAPVGKESITVCHVLFANDKTGTLFWTIFEAPTTNWDEAWKSGEIILKKMLLDDEQ